MFKSNSYFLIFTLLLVVIIKMTQGLFTFHKILIPKFWVLFGYMAGITFMAINLCLFSVKKSLPNSWFIILSTNVIKLILSLFFVLFYLQVFKVQSVLFVANFFLVYLCFTSFEIYTLLLNLRHLNKK
ncbi:MAG: hypothetical protein EAZ51_09825 [Sphingobacteriales bacterium]|nr:MAG: hypothetical protein EAZ64_01200 [Sphingobacteriales bacterium]TAF78259.1 MAG: hypothetical protein EAZ51_09825 [Sphingobacteriales bacterium]